ncbi:MAG: sensor histidine kinase [Oscillospiraceae bacterium]|nr:sensor histidine kinase [Oscillospiraceae bacterium]
MKFVLELLFAEFIFLYPADRRKHFALRLAGVFLVLMAGYLLVPRREPLNQPLFVQILIYLFLFGLTVAGMSFCFRLRFSALFSLCVAGYAVEHIAYHTAKIVQATTGLFRGMTAMGLADWELAELVVFPPVYLLAFLTIGLFSARTQGWKKPDLRFNALSIAVMLICIGLTRVVNQYKAADSIPVNIYAITCCLMALVVQFVLYRLVDLQTENTALNLMWQEERKQYELSKKTIDTINIKYHDLKHKLHDMRLPPEEVESIKNAVRIYGSRIHTGNEALDVLLTENSLRCSEEGIRLTYTGNGADLSFMQIMDVYSLFGNAVSNAVEAVEKLEDPEKKIIDIISERRGELVSIHISNYFAGTLHFEDGVPKTSKTEEEGFHGYGMKSMKLIAEKYGGSLCASVDGDLFTLDIYLLQN